MAIELIIKISSRILIDRRCIRTCVVPLETVLQGLGEGIEKLFTTDEMLLLKALERGKLRDQQKLVDIVLDMNTKWDLLRDKEKRAVIINRLEEDDAFELAFLLGIEHGGFPYKAIQEKRFNKNSKAEKVFFAFFGFQVPEEEEEIEHETIEGVEALHGLYKHQRDSLRKVEKFLEDDGRVLLHMPTGSGKTRTAMNLISKHLNRTDNSLVLWLAHSEELCEQAVGEFKKSWSHLGDRPIQVRRFFKSHDWEDMEEGLIVAGLNKLWNYLKDSPDLSMRAKKISLIVFDEAHQSVAQTFQLPVNAIMTWNRECRLLGLTATPGRTWNDISADEELADMYHRNKVSLEVKGYISPLDYLIEEGYLSKPIFTPIPNPTETVLSSAEKNKLLKADEDIPDSILNRISEDGIRNAMIVKKAEQLVKSGHKRLLIFAINVRHAKTINSFLRFRGYNSSLITSQTDSGDRKQSIRLFKEEGGGSKILCNYGVLTTGFDAPKTSAAIIARPTKSLVLYSQMIGRALRGPLVGGTEEAEICTVVDTSLKGFGNLGEAFANWEDVWRGKI